jgi:hypothetical protein
MQFDRAGDCETDGFVGDASGLVTAEKGVDQLIGVENRINHAIGGCAERGIRPTAM